MSRLRALAPCRRSPYHRPVARKRLEWTLTDSDDDVQAYKSQPPQAVRDVRPEDLDVVFQPIVDLASRRTFAYEALARCKLPAFKNPAVLFDTAAEAGSSGRLGRSVRDILFARLQREAVFINVHPAELITRWLVRPDDPLCLHPGPVFIEITESAAFEHFDIVRSSLSEIQGRTGASLVIDDFGAGYSNLRRISDLEPAVVKLDRALVTGLPESRRHRLLVRGVVQLCVDIGARVVAEGIENVDELRAVIDVGAHYGQGYLLARPGFPLPAVRWPEGA